MLNKNSFESLVMSLIELIKKTYKRLEYRSYRFLSNNNSIQNPYLIFFQLAKKIDYSTINFNDHSNYSEVKCFIVDVTSLTALLNYIAYILKQDDSIRIALIESRIEYKQSLPFNEFFRSNGNILTNEVIVKQIDEILTHCINLSQYYYDTSESEYRRHNNKFLKPMFEDLENMFQLLIELALK